MIKEIEYAEYSYNRTFDIKKKTLKTIRVDVTNTDKVPDIFLNMSPENVPFEKVVTNIKEKYN